MFGARKSHGPRQEIAHQINPVRQPAPGKGWFAFQSGPFRPLSGQGRCWSPRICACGSRLLLMQRRHPQPRLRNADRPFWTCANSMTELDFCALQGHQARPHWDHAAELALRLREQVTTVGRDIESVDYLRQIGTGSHTMAEMGRLKQITHGQSPPLASSRSCQRTPHRSRQDSFA
jgi:hypothetical protein